MYLLATGLSLIWMVLSSWLFVLGRLKLLFFLWRREQHEPSPCGDEESEEAREPVLFIMEISMQFVWNVCSSTNSWFCTGRGTTCCSWITSLGHRLARLSGEWRRFTLKSKQTEQNPLQKLFNIWKMNHQGNRNISAQMSILSAICGKHSQLLSLWQMSKTWRSASKNVSHGLPVGGRVTLRRVWRRAPRSDAFSYTRLLHCTTLPCIMHIHEMLDANVCSGVRLASRPLWSFSQTTGKPFNGAGGSSARGNTDLLPVRVSVQGFRAASVKLMSQPSIKEEALRSLNYT